MTQFVGPAPIWTDVTSEEYQLWFSKVASAINENAVTGVAEGGGTDLSGLVLDSTTGEITQDDILYGYFRRYLHVRFASDADGTTSVDNTQLFTGDTIYIGTFNTDNEDLPANANFVYRPFNWGTGFIASNRLEGGRRVEFFTGTELPAGNARKDIATVIDLDAIRGQDGFTPVAYYSENLLTDRPTENPAENPAIWDRQDIAVSSNENYNWIIWGFEGTSDQRSQYSLTASGTTGSVTGSQTALREEGNIVVDSCCVSSSWC